ncbi:MAG: GNAT family N-acetyltransferase [Caulobacterales bacterium]
MTVAYPIILSTERLTLRPFTAGDAPRVLEIDSNWNVMRMQREAEFPATAHSVQSWLANHEPDWRAGTAYRFAIWTDGRLIGCCDTDCIEAGVGDFGYWLDEAAWGRGYATEAARAVLDFAFGPVGLAALNSGCAHDNPASARILEKLGFHHIGNQLMWSNPRGEMLDHRRYRLDRADVDNRLRADDEFS